MRRIRLAVAVLGLAAPSALAAQARLHSGPARFTGGGTLVAVQPLGEFGDHVDAGVGLGAHGLLRLDRAGALTVRFDGGFAIYGSERVRVANPLTGRVTLEVETTNNIGTFGVGPQIMVPSGRVRPYANAGVGVAWFFTRSVLKGGDRNGTPFAETTNEQDATLAWTGGGGLYIPLSMRGRTVSLDVGARYHGNGTATYLTEGGIVDNPAGSVTETPFRTRADFVAYHLGVSVGY